MPTYNEKFSAHNSKLDYYGRRIPISENEAIVVMESIFINVGCKNNTAHIISKHLAEASLSGVESHGVMRTLQYADQFCSGAMKADGIPKLVKNHL